jgi:hypothetical protein
MIGEGYRHREALCDDLLSPAEAGFAKAGAIQ